MQHPRFTVDGPEVRRRRMGLGLEIADVATRVGISRSYLSRIEVNSLRLTPSTYMRLREALHCKPDEHLLADSEATQKGRSNARATRSRTGP